MRPTADSPNLDLLRTLAVSYVVVLHLLLFFKGEDLGLLGSIGFWGVLLFFVHTSLVLMFSLERQKARFPEANIALLFYVRRCFRILPLSMLVVTAVAVFRWPVGYVLPGRFYAIHLSALGVISNLFLLQNLTHTRSITGPLWSLPYEMGMYLVFPALYLLVRATRNVRLVAGFWIATALVGYIALRIFHRGYPSSISLAPCFMAGIVSYKLGQLNSVKKLPFIGWPIMILLTTYLYLRQPTPQRGWICCLLVGISVPYFSEMSSTWLQTLCHTVARYSYGIYLVHFICIWLAFERLGKLPVAVRWLVFMVTVAAIPIILYHLLESPMISLGRRITDRMAVRAEKVPQLIPAVSVEPGNGDFPLTL
jgi:peptidoglycan/LPS O-acetylase OafA/YrhL